MLTTPSIRPVAVRGCPFLFDEVAAHLGMLPGHEAMRVWSDVCHTYEGFEHRYRVELSELDWYKAEFAAWRRRLH